MTSDKPPYPVTTHEQAFSVLEDDRVILRRFKTSESPTLALTETGAPLYERRYLMRSPKGHYFQYNEFTSAPSIEPLTMQEALEVYIGMTPVKDLKEAFPDVVEEDA